MGGTVLSDHGRGRRSGMKHFVRKAAPDVVVEVGSLRAGAQQIVVGPAGNAGVLKCGSVAETALEGLLSGARKPLGPVTKIALP